MGVRKVLDEGSGSVLTTSSKELNCGLKFPSSAVTQDQDDPVHAGNFPDRHLVAGVLHPTHATRGYATNVE